MAETATQLSGLRKAAIMLVQMGKEQSAKVLGQMRESEVEELTAEIMRLGTIDGNIAEEVLDEFHNMAVANRYAHQGGLDYAKELLEASLGREAAEAVVNRLSAAFVEMPFAFLQKADPRQVLSFVQEEHPQTIALVLAHMPAAMASQILSGLAGELQADVAHRIAIMDRTSPDIIRQVESTLERKLSSVLQPSDLSAVGGLQPLVDIINRADRATERLIMEGLAARDPELAEEVRSKMFMFEDITGLDDRAVQLVLRQVETNDLATALKGVREDVREKVTRNLSARAAENLVEEIDMLGAVRLRQVEESQAKIVQVIRALEESGQIMIRRGDDDEFVA
ncbi:flagellar motor switch protein FliG [Planosporangium flavigriseum]|uniref:Flagellar motor switch protein FliG n=1 Tax=Planosporangium flavigriseum TaxID=373681 RepID=A0A8J3LMV8_9ACTN|nr:flagellar motor switch protein FliG [Planosporangium flavigriseum]NJC66360.1 flagellar motor switch protein FliG [Planosporangium flavigriseum]GIG74234.1 flagellar motor switch protein FliG [Planosporangium flavigriseum]